MGATTQQTINWARQIVTLIVKTALEKGYKLSVDCEGETMVAPTTDEQEILDMCFGVDVCHLYYHVTINQEGETDSIGWVFLVFGNDGYDVLSDHTVNLNEELQGAYDLSDRIQRGET